MSTRSTTTWKGAMGFEAEVSGHKFMIDADEAVGGQNAGPRPKPLMLTALAGCTAMDVISILRKMRIESDIEDFKVHVDGDLTDEHPKYFHTLKVTYEFTPKPGKVLDREKLEKAATLSEERYCGVAAVYKKTMTMSFEIVINENPA